MAPLESLFSEQVSQSYLNEPFPIRSDEPHEDRLFRHITFPEDNSDLTLRLRAVNRNYKTESAVVQKRVHTNLPVSHKEKFRVKAVLSKSDHGITESHWVTQEKASESPASSHNQYRIRAVSKENWKSDWVYSELRDSENDLIVYNMLYDVLDLLMGIHDDQIDFLMDYVVNDTFIKVIQEKAPGFATLTEFDEIHELNLSEWLEILSSREDLGPQEEMVSQLGERFISLSKEMKKEFHEKVMSSPEEFAELYRMYKLFDQYQTKQNDFVGLLVEIFLEDRLEKLVQKTDIEVLLQNEEETGIYLNGTYEFNIKNELITSIYDASLDDHFVSNLSDAVQLITEPVIYESIVYQRNEEVAKFLNLALLEVYTPLVANDLRILELEHELEDMFDKGVSGSIVEFATTDDDFMKRYMLLYDVVESLIKGDLDLSHEYEVVILDHMLRFVTDSRKALFIDYNFGEFIEIFFEMGESFRHEYKKEFGLISEDVYAVLKDDTKRQSTKSTISLLERFNLAWKDVVRIAHKNENERMNEKAHVSWLEHIQNKYMLFKSEIRDHVETILSDSTHRKHVTEQSSEQDELSILARDNVLQQDVRKYLDSSDSTILDMLDLTHHRDINQYKSIKREVTVGSEDLYFNLFKHHLREPNRYPLLEDTHFDLSHDLRDVFIIDGTDLIQFALGDTDDGWPVGVFRLGVNTLKGEVSRNE